MQYIIQQTEQIPMTPKVEEKYYQQPVPMGVKLPEYLTSGFSHMHEVTPQGLNPEIALYLPIVFQ